MNKNALILLLLLPTFLSAQTWEWAKQIGGPGVDNAFIGHVDSQHNIYLYGNYAGPYADQTFSNCYIEEDTLFGSDAGFIAKYDNSGNLLWVKNCVSPYGSMGFELAFDITNNVFYLAGLYDISCNIDTCHLFSGYYNTGFLAKLDVNGNCLWAKNIATPGFATTYGGPLTFDNDGNVYMAGYSNAINKIDTSTITAGTFLAKFDSHGNNLWAKTKFSYTPLHTQMNFGSLRYYNNSIYAAGSAYVSGTNSTLQIDTVSVTNLHGTGYGLVCMDANNSTAKWMKFEGQPHTNVLYPMMDMDNKGNIYCIGTFYDTCVFSHDTLIAYGYSNGSLSKYDSSGNLIWLKQLYATNLFGCAGVTAKDDSSVIIAGTFAGQGTFGSFIINSNTYEDLYIARYNKNGTIMGVDHAGTGEGLSIAADEGSIYMTGTFPPDPSNDIPGSITIGADTFTSYGWGDIVFAKHGMITGIQKKTLKNDGNSIVIYANPNKGSFRVIVPEDFINEKSLLLNIYDNTGKLIKNQYLQITDDRPSVDIYGVKPGQYSITVSNGKKIYYGKMIVE